MWRFRPQLLYFRGTLLDQSEYGYVCGEGGDKSSLYPVIFLQSSAFCLLFSSPVYYKMRLSPIAFLPFLPTPQTGAMHITVGPPSINPHCFFS